MEEKIATLSLGQEDPLEEEMATHSNILAWRISWTGKPGRLQSMGSQSPIQLSNYTVICLQNICNDLWSSQQLH